ncbi:MAG: hypothetical protein LAO20_06255 [Acidobacteriia bacterium]|nr:hypothetical protein [Terriglobia bacterium]
MPKKKAPRKKAARSRAGNATNAAKTKTTRKQDDLNREAARLIREAQREMVKQAVARLVAETAPE